MKRNISSWYYTRYILAFIISATITISTAGFFVMSFNTANTFIGCSLVFIGWLLIMAIVGTIIFKITHKIFKL